MPNITLPNGAVLEDDPNYPPISAGGSTVESVDVGEDIPDASGYPNGTLLVRWLV